MNVMQVELYTKLMNKLTSSECDVRDKLEVAAQMLGSFCAENKLTLREAVIFLTLAFEDPVLKETT